MACFAEFFEDVNFSGYSEQFTLTDNWRYWWIKFDSQLAHNVSSFRANAFAGTNAHAYGFSTNDFLGNYAALNMSEGWTCWWSSLGGMNDQIQSALLINRNKLELSMAVRDQIAPDFATEFDIQARGQNVSRRGDPRVYAVFFPSYDPDKIFVRIEQDLTVHVRCWSDYDAQVHFDVSFNLANNVVSAFTAWVYTWVESGIFSGQIDGQLHPKMVAAAGTLNQKLFDKLALLNLGIALEGYKLGSIYLLPGRLPLLPPPSSNFGHMGNATEDCVVVLTRDN